MVFQSIKMTAIYLGLQFISTWPDLNALKVFNEEVNLHYQWKDHCKFIPC